jgi:hypothetical protein
MECKMAANLLPKRYELMRVWTKLKKLTTLFPVNISILCKLEVDDPSPG